MDVSVLTPWRPGDAHREAAWRWVRAKYEQLGWQVIEGRHDEGPWCKALAVADAFTRADGDVLLISDADCWVDNLPDTVHHLETWAIPHRWVHRLTEQATALALDTGFVDLDDVTDHPYWGVDGGGIVAIHRDVYRDIPLDPRFQDWGGEDRAWGIALHHLAGHPWQGRGRLIHLWHPPQGNAAGKRGPRGEKTFRNATTAALVDRYRHAKQSRAAMRALVDEAKEVLWPSISS